MATVAAANDLKWLTNRPQDFEPGNGLPLSDRRVVVAQQAVARAEEDLARLRARIRERGASWRAASQVRAACWDWLRNGKPHGVVLQDIDWPEPVFKGSHSDALEARRRRARELRADLKRTLDAPLPSAWSKERVRELVPALGERGSLSAERLIELGDPTGVEFPTIRSQVEIHNAGAGAIGFLQTTDVVGLLSHLFGPTIIAALDRAIDAESDDKAALSNEDRQIKASEIERDLLAVQRDIASLTWRGISEGLPVEFDADLNPIAILGLELVTAPRADVPGSHPLHAFDVVAGR